MAPMMTLPSNRLFRSPINSSRTKVMPASGVLNAAAKASRRPGGRAQPALLLGLTRQTGHQRPGRPGDLHAGTFTTQTAAAAYLQGTRQKFDPQDAKPNKAKNPSRKAALSCGIPLPAASLRQGIQQPARNEGSLHDHDKAALRWSGRNGRAGGCRSENRH